MRFPERTDDLSSPAEHNQWQYNELLQRPYLIAEELPFHEVQDEEDGITIGLCFHLSLTGKKTVPRNLFLGVRTGSMLRGLAGGLEL